MSSYTIVGLLQLERLDLEDCIYVSGVTLSDFAMHCGKLFKLSMCNCGQITDVGVQSLCISTAIMDNYKIYDITNYPNDS